MHGSSDALHALIASFSRNEISSHEAESRFNELVENTPYPESRNSYDEDVYLNTLLYYLTAYNYMKGIRFFERKEDQWYEKASLGDISLLDDFSINEVEPGDVFSRNLDVNSRGNLTYSVFFYSDTAQAIAGVTSSRYSEFGLFISRARDTLQVINGSEITNATHLSAIPSIQIDGFNERDWRNESLLHVVSFRDFYHIFGHTDPLRPLEVVESIKDTLLDVAGENSFVASLTARLWVVLRPLPEHFNHEDDPSKYRLAPAIEYQGITLQLREMTALWGPQDTIQTLWSSAFAFAEFCKTGESL